MIGFSPTELLIIVAAGIGLWWGAQGRYLDRIKLRALRYDKGLLTFWTVCIAGMVLLVAYLVLTQRHHP